MICESACAAKAAKLREALHDCSSTNRKHAVPGVNNIVNPIALDPNVHIRNARNIDNYATQNHRVR